MTALFIAAQNGHTGVVEALLGGGANTELQGGKVRRLDACWCPPRLSLRPVPLL